MLMKRALADGGVARRHREGGGTILGHPAL